MDIIAAHHGQSWRDDEDEDLPQQIRQGQPWQREDSNQVQQNCALLSHYDEGSPGGYLREASEDLTAQPMGGGSSSTGGTRESNECDELVFLGSPGESSFASWDRDRPHAARKAAIALLTPISVDSVHASPGSAAPAAAESCFDHACCRESTAGAVALLTPVSVDTVQSPQAKSPSPGVPCSQKSTSLPFGGDSDLFGGRRERETAVALLTPVSVDTVQSPETKKHPTLPLLCRHSSPVELLTPESVFTEAFAGRADRLLDSPEPGFEGVPAAAPFPLFVGPLPGTGATSGGGGASGTSAASAAARRPRPGIVAQLFP